MTAAAGARNAERMTAGAAGPVVADWIAADWGTSNLRAWAMGADGAALASASSGAGAAGLGREEFEPALLDLVGGWLGDAPTRVAICGMAGSRQGWTEAPYRPVPAAPLGAGTAALTADPRLKVRILGGVSQTNPPDVMRGEETQIAGLLAARPGFEGVVCLPGTHSKWAHVTGGEIFHFVTFMTGELFELLSRRSILRHALDGEGLDEAAFDAALDDAMGRPERVAAKLFSIRAEGLLTGLSPAAARGRLSGLLIGMELAGAKPWWLGREIALIGAEPLTRLYRRALASTGIEAATLAADAATLDGLRAAHALWLEEDRP